MLLSNSRCLWITFYVCAAMLLPACDGIITRQTERDWQDRFRATLLPGYSDFHGLEISADVGLAIFQYRLPHGVTDEAALTTIVRQVEGNSCARLIKRDQVQIQLRCGNASSTPNGFEEYRAAVNERSRTVVVMYGDFDSDAEIQRYPAIETLFQEHTRR